VSKKWKSDSEANFPPDALKIININATACVFMLYKLLVESFDE